MADESAGFSGGGTSGFGEVSTPGVGTTAATTANTTPSSGQSPVTDPATGQTIDISDDTLIKGVPGFNEPVRYGDLYKRLQSDYTKKTQAAEKLRQEAAAERAKYQSEYQSERKRLEDLAKTLIQRRDGQVNSTEQDPLFKELASAQYIDGPMMGKFISAMQEKGFVPIVKAFQERDQIIQGLFQQVLDMRKQVNELVTVRTGQDTEGKINRWLTEGGYPQEAKNLAKEIYTAYEGDDLDNEFPQIFEQRWNEIQSIIRAQDRKRVEDAKRASTRLPGRGGSGAPGKPIGLKGHEKARDVASALWDAMQVDGDNT